MIDICCQRHTIFHICSKLRSDQNWLDSWSHLGQTKYKTALPARHSTSHRRDFHCVSTLISYCWPASRKHAAADRRRRLWWRWAITRRLRELRSSRALTRKWPEWVEVWVDRESRNWRAFGTARADWVAEMSTASILTFWCSCSEEIRITREMMAIDPFSFFVMYSQHNEMLSCIHDHSIEFVAHFLNRHRNRKELKRGEGKTNI